MRRALALAMLFPAPARAHDAFGDLGPFYASLLHPFADPLQGLLLLGVAVLLAFQPRESLQAGYAAVPAGALLGLLAGSLVAGSDAGGAAMAGGAVLMGLAAILRLRPGRVGTAALAGLAAAIAALSGDPAGTGREAALAVAGAALGIALVTLFAWGAADLAVRRVGPVAGAVAGAWIAAAGIMSAALAA